MLGHPIPIYSSEGVAYLKNAGYQVPGYAAYFDAWHAEFAKEREHYMDSAHAHLSTAHQLEEWLGAEWFAMRGFDVKLMAEGGPMRK